MYKSFKFKDKTVSESILKTKLYASHPRDVGNKLKLKLFYNLF